MRLRQWLAAGGLVLSLILLRIAMTVKPFSFADAHGTNSIASGQVLVKQRSQSPIKLSQKTDFDHESSKLIVKVFYQRLSDLHNSMTPTGASRANIHWERAQAARWYIEEQRYGEDAIVGGSVVNNPEAIQAGFKMFDWGFAHQAADGSFPGTADSFHSTSFFVEAVAHTLLFLQQSPQAGYADRIAHYTPLVHRAARWMISPKAWKKGIERNEPYTHRRYLVAAALGLTGKLTGDRELIDYAHQSLEDGLSLQRADGVNPEKGGYDSSYQTVGIIYAERWVTYFPHDPLTPQVATMIDKALAWEQTRILRTGEISSEGNTRTNGQEKNRIGKVKQVGPAPQIRAFAYWASVTNNPEWEAIARRIAQHYHQLG